MAIDYKQAGVDIAAGDALVDWLKVHRPAKWPHEERLVSGIGGFAALFRGDFADMKEPLLVSATDGVGTKVKLAAEFNSYRGVGQDLVAMCVNDLICTGAAPLFFLDYYACGKLELEVAKEFLAGVQDACIKSHCMLIGGETAEMPGVYSRGDFDCAGFAVGVVDRPKVLGPHRVRSGDRLLGISSSGFHSNGYSLLRRVFEKDLSAWREVLLRPTNLYVDLALSLFQIPGLHALAHITGGGMDNLLRVLPESFQAQLRSWPVPGEFKEVRLRAELSWSEMLTTLNCGVGLIAVVDEDVFDQAHQIARNKGFGVFDLGRVESGSGEKMWHLESLENESLG